MSVSAACGTTVPSGCCTPPHTGITNVRGEVVATTRSGREGGYVITELVAGEYTLAASAPAFSPAAVPVTVKAARETSGAGASWDAALFTRGVSLRKQAMSRPSTSTGTR
ncbi:carboxypeptidase regulatory-like domain-containing protein [Streptomyces sp. uw30]|uniref:carboxypeptidase regulatory-like domain-containing protein n=1 Tax=Streptomyces sp. uw30 TaxID=1828179 RepID=UPI0039679371